MRMRDISQACMQLSLASSYSIKLIGHTHTTQFFNKTKPKRRLQTTLPTRPACIQLLVHVKHMHSKAQLPFVDTRTSIHALCTKGTYRGRHSSQHRQSRFTCASHHAADASCMHTIVGTCQAHAQQCTTTNCRHLH